MLQCVERGVQQSSEDTPQPSKNQVETHLVGLNRETFPRNDQRMELCESSLTPSGLVRVQAEEMNPIDSSPCLGLACVCLNKIWLIYSQNMCKAPLCGRRTSFYCHKQTADNQSGLIYIIIGLILIHR